MNVFHRRNSVGGIQGEALSRVGIGTAEIERKWIVSEVPDLTPFTAIPMAQGYLASSAGDYEERVRSRGGEFFRTVKIGKGLVRIESESKISEQEFQTLWARTEGRRVEKDRYIIPANGAKIELDLYRASLSGLVVAEVEFPSREASTLFVAPSWFGPDVTTDARYSNKNLAFLGRPKT